MLGQAVKEQELTEQQSFCNSLFNGFNSHVEIRIINKQKQVEERKFMSLEDLSSYEPPMDKNVYIGMFERRTNKNGTAENCSKTNTLWADFDGMELVEISYRIEMAKIPSPSMIINSGNGYHVYWILNKSIGHEVLPILKALTTKLNADPKAAEVARVLRLPGTNNVKGDVKQCEIVMADNGLRHSIKQFESVLGVKAEIIQEKRTGAIPELLEVNHNGLHNMAFGVGKGERNFCVGRIVQTLKRLNYTKHEVKDILFRWNDLNSPAKDFKELKGDFETFWHKDELKFAGKEFADDRLQELNLRFIDKEAVFFKPDEVSSHHYDNELLKPEIFHKISGLTFAILSTIKLAESEGIRREHIADLCDRDSTDKKLRDALKELQKMKYITVKKQGRTNFYYFTEKANYKRGFTAVPKMLHRLFIKKDLTEPEYKLLILLESFAYDNKGEIYPSNLVLSHRMGQTERNIRNNLKRLEHKQYIKTELKKGKRFIRLTYR